MIEGLKRTKRDFSKESRPININTDKGILEIGGKSPIIIAGPCSVESEDQIVSIARSVKAAGANLLRGGAYKPRTSPYDFQGMRADGLDLLKIAKEETGLPIVSEIVGISHLDQFADVDILQVGARNMQNFELLKELGKIGRPVLLKRGFSSTIKEWLMSAEYLMYHGNDQVILCERGIRTFSDVTRNTLDLSVVPILKEVSHLPIIVDPSHGTGISSLVGSMSLAAIAAGADGLMIEVHNDPQNALSDGDQSILPSKFAQIVDQVGKIKIALEG
ncbi:3-deoxy-7-phosphoheptulonate synthase [Peptostreptococcus sp. MV1]|uniref:3-deoxy-7-phosphoheptulonate synthase n=1 Tax=Peptostreptococcus sp. MV1 TaxID=1219626 RepID=UPI0006911A7B|nr:3-deoxy-7-phosphoheptulonate synthase [Peptostreptococcus sp. MV1]